MSIKDSFIAHFGESDATMIEAAANGHMNGVHDNVGSDRFRWAIAIAIGYQCMELDEYREHHGIKSPWAELKEWIKTEAHFEDHDGDVDYISLLCGKYNEYMPEEFQAKINTPAQEEPSS